MSADGLKAAAVTVLGLGHLRPAPGTWGSIPPPALVMVMLLAGAPARSVDVVLVALAMLASVACLRFGAWAQARYGRLDPRQVVADEVAGQSVALVALPWHAGPDGLAWNAAVAATAFVCFRALDIIKPPPARRAERLGGGLGILADDLLAGLYALAATQALVRWGFPGWAGVA